MAKKRKPSKDAAPATATGLVKQPASLSTDGLPAEYGSFLADLKARIAAAQTRAALAVNAELIELYWTIGRDILHRQTAEGWGAKIVERLAKDLRAAFPEMSGFSRANLMYMRAFAEAYPDARIVQQAVGQIPWGHNVILIDRVKNAAQRLWYPPDLSEDATALVLRQAELSTSNGG